MFGLSKEEKRIRVEFEDWLRRSNIEIARAIALDGLTGEHQRAALERIRQAEEKLNQSRKQAL